nr:YifB family Mg chelatase-like AAA ATPase [Lachnospiraceae bacterium]
IHPISGILPMVIGARNSGIKKCVLPAKNVREAELVPDMEIIGVRDLTDTIEYFSAGKCPEREKDIIVNVNTEDYPDFASINGQVFLKRACEVAAAGMHNILMIGPPGAGKSLAAKCIPGILPPMTKDEMLEVSKIYSVCGLLEGHNSLVEKRPFRTPHHTVSTNGFTGGGSVPKPGEISLAHKGVLFLDEFPEFKRETIEVMRQPLEDKKIHIVRVNGEYTFPADFMLVAAMNPCKCGLFPNVKCRCTEREISMYLGKISQPLLDRIDICVEAKQISFKELTGHSENESSVSIRKRVEKAHLLQKERFKEEGFLHNSQIPGESIEKYCLTDDPEKEYLRKIYEDNDMSARTFHKLLRVARTIADLGESETIKKEHIFEALQYKSIDKKYWNKRSEYEFNL